MITDVPTPEDFLRAGLRFMSVGWGETLETATAAKEALSLKSEDGPRAEDFWTRARVDFAVALATVQQGVELLLKAEIARTSPYLLISQDQGKWSQGGARDVPFSEFRSIDSKDLVKAYHTVSRNRLPEPFITKFNAIRGHRNVIFHSVSGSKTEAIEVIVYVLEATNALLEKFSWPKLRQQALRETPWGLFPQYEYDADVLAVNIEIAFALDSLKPAEGKALLGVDKKATLYVCPNCYGAYCGAYEELNFRLAQLAETQGVWSVTCPVCGERQRVVRERCGTDDCAGDVLSEDGLCLTCTANE